MTQGVPLLICNIESFHTNGTLGRLVVTVNATISTNDFAAVFSDIRLSAAGLIYSPWSTPTSGIEAKYLGGSYSWEITFSNIAVPFPADIPVPVRILANIRPNANGILEGIQVSAILSAYTKGETNPIVEDSGSNVIPVQGAIIEGSPITLTSADVSLSSLSATLGSAIMNSGVTVGYNVSYSFWLTAGNSTLFMSSNPTNALSTVATGGASLNLSIAGIVANPGSISGDTQTTTANGYYVIPAGSSRQFSFNGSFMNTNGVSGLKTASITGVYYGTSTTNLTAHSINYNLQNLRVSASF